MPERQITDPNKMTLLQHLEELRRRLIKVTVVIVLALIACFSLAPALFDFLRAPLDHVAERDAIVLQVLGPLEMFVTYLKLSLLAALFVTAPWVLLQMWMFVAPGLYKHEKRWILPFVILGSLFFVGGAAFAFEIVLPMGFDYLVQMTPDIVKNEWSVEKYYSVVVQLLIAFGVVFELPLIMWILAAAGVVEPKTFSRLRKYWIVTAFVVGGILTPPDPFTQILMAVPLLVFFELGVLGARLLNRRRQARAA